MNVVLDTNILVNLFYVDQPYHEKAKEIWKKYERIYIPETVLFELIYLIFKKNQPLDLIKLLVYDEKVEIINNNINDLMFAINNKPKSYDEFNDYMILHTALRLNANLETFDEELLKEFKRYKH